MTTDAELTASERESYRATIVALDAALAKQKALNWRMLEKRARDAARIGRLRSRLARVLRASQDRMWLSRCWRSSRDSSTPGGVWSRCALPTPTPKEPDHVR